MCSWQKQFKEISSWRNGGGGGGAFYVGVAFTDTKPGLWLIIIWPDLIYHRPYKSEGQFSC